MKKIFKSRILIFILGAILFGGIGVVSAYSILASDIGFTPKDSTWKKSNGEDITNVKDAIDELYMQKDMVNLFNDYNINSSYGTPINNYSFKLNTLSTIAWYNLGINTRLIKGKYRLTIKGLKTGRIALTTTTNTSLIDNNAIIAKNCKSDVEQFDFELNNNNNNIYYVWYCSDTGTPQEQNIILKLQRID